MGRQGGKADPPDDDDPSESDPDEGESSHSEEEKKKKKKTKSRKKKKSHQSSESDSEEEVMSDRERLRRSRKAAPNTTTVAALVKTAVKLNANTDNYRAWLISMKETALYQGWPSYIMDSKAAPWVENDKESITSMKSRREAFQVLVGSLDSKLLQALETVREGDNFGNAQVLFRKIQQLYSRSCSQTRRV